LGKAYTYLRMASHVHQLVQHEGNKIPNPKPEKIINVACSWLNIFSVDSVTQTFEVDVVLRLRWMEPATERVLSHFTELQAADGKQYNVSKKDFMDNCWDPQFQFPNCRDFSNAEEWVKMDRAGEQIHVCWAVRFHSTKFTCVFDLRNFPFDQQSLVIRVSSTWDEKKVQFRANPVDPVLQSYGDYNLQDYSLTTGRVVDVTSRDSRDDCYTTRSDAGSSTSGVRYNSAFLIQVVARNPGFYLLNLYLPTFLISSCSFACFAFVVDEFAGRSAILVTLLLTVVAFKQVIGQHLPRLPYLTYLDRYVLTGLSLVVIVGILTSSLAAASVCVDTPTRKPTLCGQVLLGTLDHQYVDYGDFICLVATSITWAFYQLFEVFMIFRARREDTGTIRKEVDLPPEQELIPSVKLAVETKSAVETKEEQKPAT